VPEPDAGTAGGEQESALKVGRAHASSEGWTRWAPAAIALAVFLLDRITKIFIRSHVGEYDSIPVIAGWFRIVHTENPGAAFGLLADASPAWRMVALIGVSLMVLVFVANALFARRSSFTGTATRFGLGFILGGAIGNLYDRVAVGTVTDFLEIYNGTWSFPAFNVADSAITVGSVLLLIELLRPQRKRVSHSIQPSSES
jgi:signal peptidase II